MTLPSARHLSILVATALTVIAGLTFHGAFDLPDITAIVVAAALVPAVLLTALDAVFPRPVPLSVTVAAGAAGWLLGLPVLAQWCAAGSSANFLKLLRTALTDGPHQLLTTPSPAQPTAVLLLTLASLVWWAAFWAVESVLRDAPPLVPALAPFLLFAAGTSASAEAGDPGTLLLALAFVVAGLCLLAIRQARQGVPAIAGMAALAVAVAAAAPVVPRHAAWNPRTLFSPPMRNVQDVDALSQAVAWLRQPQASPLLTVATATPDEPLRWLVYDTYDGRRWSSSARYSPAGKNLPPDPDPATGSGSPVHDEVTLAGLPGPWLPVPGRPRHVTGPAVSIDARLGVLATDDGAAAGRVSYIIDGEVPERSETALHAARQGSGPEVDPLRELPAGLPDEVADWIRQAENGTDPYGELLNLATVTHDAFAYNPAAASAQSYGSLRLALPQGPGTKSAQSLDLIATFFALAAREAGFPSRIVVGFVPGARIAADQYAVTTADVRIWPEVSFDGIGWVPFPQAMPSTSDVVQAGAPVGRQPTGAPSAAPPSSAMPSTTASGPSVVVKGPEKAVSHTAMWVGLAGAPILLCIGYLAVALVLRRRVRAVRKKDPDPRRRTLWAWEESLTALSAAGLAADASSTPHEAATASEGVLGTDEAVRVRRLASLAESAVYAPTPPLPAEADEAWSYADRIRVLTRPHTPRRARAAAVLRPPRSRRRH